MSFQTRQLGLASKSQARAAMLVQAGLELSLFAADIDERALDAEWSAKGASPAEIADQLARAKALDVSKHHPGFLIIGADQTLDCAGKRYSKPKDLAQAARHLREFSGKPHELHSAVALAQDSKVIWSSCATAIMSVRPLSDDFITTYLSVTGEKILGSVGCYHYEGLGLQLFDKVEGDYHTILGMPLLALLNHLRQTGILLS